MVCKLNSQNVGIIVVDSVIMVVADMVGGLELCDVLNSLTDDVDALKKQVVR
jgi:hypothetical protein